MQRMLVRFVNAIRLPLLIIIGFIFALIIVAQNVYFFEIGDNITRLKAQNRALKIQNEELQANINRVLEERSDLNLAAIDFELHSARLGDVVHLSDPKNEGFQNSELEDTWVKLRGFARDTWDKLFTKNNLDKAYLTGQI